MPQVILTAPLHEETRGKIKTLHEIWCWAAWRDSEGPGFIGHGTTEDEAKRDLLEKERTCPKS